ncbi:DUF6056 family protein [Streptomyces sp. NPDC059092]|uniref:DUF6056 family protein n=1 Tax=Streptomyces sp. NPDC059092 TaxID=3346725 RepID=UPI0036AC310A
MPLGLLGAAAWIGRHVRPSGDDWCFLPVTRDDGMTGLIGKFYFQDNGRIANALLVGVYARFGVAGHQWFGVFSALLILGALWAVTALALGKAGLRAPRGVPLFVASMVTVVFLFATPNIYKTFYWPASSVSHTVAPVLACVAVVPLLLARTRAGRTTALVTVGVAGCFMGTLSEETSLVSLVVLLCVLVLSRWMFAERRRAYARFWCLAGIAGIGIGTLVLFTSPGSHIRRERYGARTAFMFEPETLIGSLRAFAHILITLLTTWQYLGAVATGILLGLLVRNSGTRPTTVVLTHRALLAATGAFAFFVSGYLCTVVAYPVFGSRVATVSRMWNDYRFLYIVLLVGAGALLGRVLRRRARPVGAAKVTSAAVCAACCLGLALPLAHLGESMSARARDWDRQDQWLRTRSASGARVLPYKSLSVSGMGEPFAHHGKKNWPARCVADYYHLRKITPSSRLP